MKCRGTNDSVRQLAGWSEVVPGKISQVSNVLEYRTYALHISFCDQLQDMHERTLKASLQDVLLGMTCAGIDCYDG